MNTKIGAAIELDNVATVNGVSQQLVLAPDGADIFTDWRYGFTLNGANNALIAPAKGRYLMGMSLWIDTDPATTLFLQAANSHSIGGGINQEILAGTPLGPQRYTYTMPGKMNVGDLLQFFVSIAGKNYSIRECFCWVQYLGMAV